MCSTAQRECSIHSKLRPSIHESWINFYKNRDNNMRVFSFLTRAKFESLRALIASLLLLCMSGFASPKPMPPSE